MKAAPGIVTVGFAASLALISSIGPARTADPQRPESSVILKLYETESAAARDAGGAPQKLDLSGYQRTDMIGYIYEGKFELVPAAGLDNMRYYAQFVGDLAKRCPKLDLESAKYQLIPYIFSGAADYLKRLRAGNLGPSEIGQTVWMGVLALNQHWACQHDASTTTQRKEAQAQCNEAAVASQGLGILPSDDAARDATLFFGRHTCDSPQARRLARQLIQFGREASSRMQFTGQMPSPSSPEGKAYSDMFESCLRTSPEPVQQEYCGCYVRTLYSLKPPSGVVQALSRNPFVDGSSYIGWLVNNVPGGRELYKCTEVFRGNPTVWREYRAARPTACLMQEKPTAGIVRECQYRAAWGEFTITGDKCEPEISSRRWGYREVDCAKGGTVALDAGAPRVWQKGVYTLIDYENDVPSGFAPALPKDAAEKLINSKQFVEIRLLKNTSLGLLKSVSLQPFGFQVLTTLGFRGEIGDARADWAAIQKEQGLVLSCSYAGAENKAVDVRYYWYEKIPQHVREGRLAPATGPYIERIMGPVATCPAKGPAS